MRVSDAARELGISADWLRDLELKGRVQVASLAHQAIENIQDIETIVSYVIALAKGAN